jgi:hypothetical protein
MLIVSRQLFKRWFEYKSPCDVFQPDVYVISDEHVQELHGLLSEHLERKRQHETS